MEKPQELAARASSLMITKDTGLLCVSTLDGAVALYTAPEMIAVSRWEKPRLTRCCVRARNVIVLKDDRHAVALFTPPTTIDFSRAAAD